MLILSLLVFFMPPNPYLEVRRIAPQYPHLMNAGVMRIPKPVGEKKALVLLVDFADNQHQYTSLSFDSLIYFDNTTSLRDYYREVSYGRFTISQTSEVTDWYRVPREYSYYVGDSFGFYPGAFPQNAQGVVWAACSLADPSIDFSQFDEDGNDTVDVVFLVHAGPGAEEGFPGYTAHIWSHQWQLSNTGTGCPSAYLTDDGVYVDYYSMEPERFELYTGRITVGVFAHEFGHILGLTDLYDTDYSTFGIGLFGLMGAGSWGRVNDRAIPGSSPTHLCAWSKYQLGFVDPVAVDRIGVSRLENQDVPCASCNPFAVRLLEDPGGPNWEYPGTMGEYFLVENRFRRGFDQSLPGDGLLILHVDDSKGSNSDESHPLVGVMQADGDLSYLLHDLGSANDLWKNSEYGFGDTSRPASLDYAGNPTGVWVYDIGPPDSIMRASFWVTPVLLGSIYSLPNPYRADREPSWGEKVIISYLPSDTVELANQFPEFKVTIYNLAAERVRVLDTEPYEIDRYGRRAFWDLKNEGNEDVVSGMYLYVIEIQGDKVERRTGRLTIIR
ncbi:MAG: M6 family metalloprotease domain-containing protein [candidate division WOR-3 bacterium]|nr:MAG: M6 family metalloprotease domain-containing protein [candidate division WOR-3 bacterium]